MNTIAVLPVKRFGRAKQRLAPDLGPEFREALAEAMVGDVLDALGRVRALDEVVLVTREQRAVALGEAAGAVLVEDMDERGQSAAVKLGIARARTLEAQRVLLVPGDCPALDPGEVAGLLAEPAGAPSVIVVPDRHGTGTNALLLAPPGAISPAFGPGSRDRHVELARAENVAVTVRELPSFGLDVDTAADLAVLRKTLERASSPPARTLRALSA